MNLDPVFVPAAAVAAAGAVLDVRNKRLPNWLCGLLAVAAAGGLYFAEGTGALPGAALHGVAALIVGMILFRLGMVGGGDAKFYAAAALGLPLAFALPFLGWTSLAGLLLLMAMVVRRVFAGGSASLKGWDVPYGVAIAAGFLATLVRPFS